MAWVIMPLLIFKAPFLFGLRSISVVIFTCTQLAFAITFFYINILWRSVLWIWTIIYFPARVLNALWRQKFLEAHLHQTQIELENIHQEKVKFQDNFHAALKEHKMMDYMLSELEEEHEKALGKIKVFEQELEDLKAKNKNLEMEKVELLTSRCEDDKSEYQPASQDDKAKGVTSKAIPDNPNALALLDNQREMVLSKSLFSAVLSLLVGIIVWEAGEPCVPLLLALFTVVVMSMKSVLQFFSVVRNTLASDAVILLCINAFILGMLVHPALPMITETLAPFFLGLRGKASDIVDD